MGPLLLAVATSLALATAPPSPAPSATPKPKPLFTVPKDWIKLRMSRPEPGVTELADYAFASRGNVQGFAVVEAPSGGLDLRDFVKVNMQQLAAGEKTFRMLADSAVSLCDGQVGRLVKYRIRSRNGNLLAFEQILAVSGTKGYIASYSRAAAQPEVPAAIAALRSICPPPAPPVAADTSTVPFTPPAGWQRLNPAALPDNVSGLIAFWMNSANGAAVPDTINLVRVNSQVGGLSSDQGQLLAAGIKQRFPDATLRQNHAETVCNGSTAGWYVEYTTKLRGEVYIIEQTVIFAQNVQYVATYGRLFTRSEDPAARRSLDTLCAPGAEVTS